MKTKVFVYFFVQLISFLLISNQGLAFCDPNTNISNICLEKTGPGQIEVWGNTLTDSDAYQAFIQMPATANFVGGTYESDPDLNPYINHIGNGGGIGPMVAGGNLFEDIIAIDGYIEFNPVEFVPAGTYRLATLFFSGCGTLSVVDPFIDPFTLYTRFALEGNAIDAQGFGVSLASCGGRSINANPQIYRADFVN